MAPTVPRTRLPHVTRHVTAGTVRANDTDATLDCLLLAPAPEWVAVDVATGALVRNGLNGETTPAALGQAGPLACVSLAVAPMSDAWDPSRPDAVELAGAEERTAPSRRSVKRLLASVAQAGTSGAAQGIGATSSLRGNGLLGRMGPSLPFVEMAGDRPSVTVLAPDAGKVRIDQRGESELVAHFRMSSAPHALPLAEGASRWVVSGAVPTISGRSVGRRRGRRRAGGDVATRGPGLETTVPVLLVVGLDRPRRGQVRKVVLGLVPAQ